MKSRQVPFAFPTADTLTGEPLSGAVYMLMDEYGSEIERATSNGFGISAFSLGTSARYLLKQIDAKTDYDTDTTIYQIVVSRQKKVYVINHGEAFAVENKRSLESNKPVIADELYPELLELTGVGKPGSIISITVKKANGSAELYSAKVSQGSQFMLKLNDALRLNDVVIFTQICESAAASEPVVLTVKKRQLNTLILI
jgi:hypothetical protein